MHGTDPSILSNGEILVCATRKTWNSHLNEGYFPSSTIFHIINCSPLALDNRTHGFEWALIVAFEMNWEQNLRIDTEVWEINTRNSLGPTNVKYSTHSMDYLE